MEKVKLIQPDFADDEVAEIFDDIRKTKGANFLTPHLGTRERGRHARSARKRGEAWKR